VSDCPLGDTCEYPLVGYGCEFAQKCGRMATKAATWARWADTKLGYVVGQQCPSCAFDVDEHTLAELDACRRESQIEMERAARYAVPGLGGEDRG
jgi:hypothetical protein